VLVDADCQHTGDKGDWLGSKRSIHLHTGFYRAWESVAPTVIPLIWAQLQQVCSTTSMHPMHHCKSLCG
jgi:hypothetical protein